MLVDGDGHPIDLDAQPVREFFRNMIDDIDHLTAEARRASPTRSLRVAGAGLRMPSSPPSEEQVVVQTNVQGAVRRGPRKRRR